MTLNMWNSGDTGRDPWWCYNECQWCNKLEKGLYDIGYVDECWWSHQKSTSLGYLVEQCFCLATRKNSILTFVFFILFSMHNQDILMQHCAEFVNHNDFSLEYIMDLLEADLMNLLYLLGIQHKHTGSLKLLAYQIYFQFKNQVLATVKELLYWLYSMPSIRSR